MSLRSEPYIYLDLYHDGQVEPSDGEGVMADMEWITYIEEPMKYRTNKCLCIGFLMIGYKNNKCDSKIVGRELWCLT